MLAFHVLIPNKYSVVNIITCFAGPTTWGQSRGLGTQQRLFSPRWHSCQMLFQTKNSLAIHMERFHKKTSFTIIIQIGRYFSILQCALSSCDFPCLDLETKVLSHSALVWIWFEWRDCLCLVSLSLEVNLSWHWSHPTLSTLLWSVALCSRAWGRLLTAWPQTLHCKLKAACPNA